jgi:hypothetical protein
MADTPISGLSELTSIADDDEIPVVDKSDTSMSAQGSTKKVKASRWVRSSMSSPLQCGRLTLTSGTAVTTSDVTGASTLYYTPHAGDVVSLYDGTTWTPRSFSELSRSLASMTSGGVYDVVLYLNGSGDLTLDLMPAWTNDTTRSSAVSLQNGVLVNTSGFTAVRSGDSVSAGRAIVVGTICMTGTSTTADSSANRYVWNLRHQVAKPLRYDSGSASHSYTSSTIRAFNNSSSSRVGVVCGLSQAVDCQCGSFSALNSASDDVRLGLGFGASTTVDGEINVLFTAGRWAFTPAISSFLAGRRDIYGVQRVFSGTGFYDFLAIRGSTRC